MSDFECCETTTVGLTGPLAELYERGVAAGRAMERELIMDILDRQLVKGKASSATVTISR